MQCLHQDQRVKSRSHIIHHNPCAFRQALQSAQRERLDDIEATKKYKARQKVFPIEWRRDERNHLPGNFVNDYKARVFAAAFPCHGG